MNYSKQTVRNAYTVMVFDGLCVSCASVIMPLLREHYGFSYDFAGLLLAILSVGNLSAGLLCGFLPLYIGQKKTAVLFTSGLFFGYLCLVIFGNPLMLILAFLIIGIGKGSSMNNGTVVTGASAEDKTKSVNLVNALFATGSLLGPILYVSFSKASFWKLPILILSASGFIVWILFITMNLDNNKKTGGGTSAKDDLTFLKDSHFWLSVLYLFMQQCVEISVTGWLVTYFKDSGILTGIFSELTVTVIWLSILIGRLIIAFVLKKNSMFRSLKFMSIASMITYVAMLFAKNSVMAILCLALFGLCESGCYPTSIAQANKSLSNASVGVMIPIAGIGAIIMPYIVGAVAQNFGIFAGMACPVVTLAGLIIVAFLPAMNESVQN